MSDSAVFKLSPHTHPSATSLHCSRSLGRWPWVHPAWPPIVLSLSFLIGLQSASCAGRRGGPQPATATHVHILEGETAPSPNPACKQCRRKWPVRCCRVPEREILGKKNCGSVAPAGLGNPCARPSGRCGGRQSSVARARPSGRCGAGQGRRGSVRVEGRCGAGRAAWGSSFPSACTRWRRRAHRGCHQTGV